MTARQKELARHALGLPNTRNRSYRNHHCVPPTLDNPNFIEWSQMVASGYARGVRDDPKLATFWLTRRGADAALQRGERLDLEDFGARA